MIHLQKKHTLLFSYQTNVSLHINILELKVIAKKFNYRYVIGNILKRLEWKKKKQSKIASEGSTMV